MDASHRAALIAFAVLLAIASLLPLGCRQNIADVPNQNAPVLRVKLVAATDQLLITATGTPLFKSAAESQPHRLRFPHGTPVLVTLGADGWHIGQNIGANIVIPPGELTIEPETIG